MSSEKPSFLSQPVVKNIYVYRNGDPYYEGRRLVINEKKVSSFETFLREVTGGVQAPFGAVRNIYTPKAGHRVSSMEHIQSGERYVAAGTEKFKKLDYSQIGTKKKKVLRSNAAMVKQVAQSRIVASARFLKPIKEPCLIFVVANGDVLNPPIRLLIPPRLLCLFERVLEMITEKMNLRIMGGVRSLYTLNGMLVSDGNDLESGQYYVAVGLEKLKKLPYSDLIFTKPASIRRFVGSKAASLPPIYRVKKQNEPVDSDQSKLMGGTNDTADSKMGSPNQGKEVPHCQARLMKLRQRKSVLTMSLGAQDNDEGDQREEEGAGDLEANQDDSVDTHLPDEKQIKGENESGTEESAGGNDDREEDGTASGAREVEEVKEEEIDGATAAVSEGEEGSTAGDTRPLVNGEMNEAEERGEERGEEDLAQILNGSEGEEDPTQILNGSEGEEDPAQILNGSEGEEDPTQILNGNEEKSEGEEDPAQILNGSEEKSEGEEDPAQILNGSEEKSEGEADNPTPAVNGNEVDGEEEGNRAKECGEETTNDPSPETEDKQAEEEREKEEDEAGDEEQENSEPEAKDDTNEGGGTSEETQEVTSPEEADPGGAPDGE